MKIEIFGYTWTVYHNKTPLRQLSTQAGVYMLIYIDKNKPNVLYVGSSSCFFRRITSHLVKKTLQEQFDPSLIVTYFHKTSKNRLKIEKELIRRFTPTYNVHFSRKKNAFALELKRLSEGRFDAWIIKKMNENGCKINSPTFSHKKKMNCFSKEERKTLSEILGAELTIQ